jgi:hypothetical protein
MGLANELRERRGFNRATVAIANKNARIAAKAAELRLYDRSYALR